MENIQNMPRVLEMKRKKSTEDKENKYKGLERVLFLLQEVKMDQIMLREIANDAITPKKRDIKVQNDLYEKIKDDDFYEGLDYDDDMIPSAEG